MDANRRLAQSRAEAVVQYLVASGTPASRIRATSAVPTEATGEAQSVTFVIGQEAY
jgi:outer membrane protein OmpA-like peptidoglycan-associated protein